MTLDEWKTQAQAKVRALAKTVGVVAPSVGYLSLAAAALGPLITAASQGQTPYGALVALFGDIGVNLLATQLHNWYERSEEQVAAALGEKAKASPAWVPLLDTLLEKFDALRVVQAVLSEADKDELIERVGAQLRQELSQYGSKLVVGGDWVGRDKIVADVQNSMGVAVGSNITQIIHIYRNAGETLDEAELERQLTSYLTALRARYGKIALLGVEYRGRNVINLDLEQVYVPLQATTRTKRRQRASAAKAVQHLAEEQGEQVVEIRLDQLLALNHQLVVTGGPGCGKTTVLQHIAWVLATALTERNPALAQEKLGLLGVGKLAARLPLPIYVPLSRFASYRRELRSRGVADDPRKITLTNFISHYLLENEAAPRLPSDFFSRLLDKGEAVILLLDGLDEVPNDDERRQICAAITRLTAGKSALRTVVTCRTAAYRGETMLDEDFHPVQVKSLEEAHVTHLVEQAFLCIEPDDVATRQQKTHELVSGIRNFEAEREQRMGESYRRLIDSPLMVRLLLLVFLTGRGFPQQRADLYERATKALLKPDYTLDDEVATQIGALVGGNVGQHRALVEYLAFAMHQQGEAQGRDRSEDEIRTLLKAAPDLAPLTEAFLQLTRVRGSLLEERLRSYRFFHLSFQEYLAACYLAKSFLGQGGMEQVVRFLEAGPLLEAWWREPALLLAGHYVSTEDLPNARLFVRRLLGVTQSAAARTALAPDVQLAAAEIALLSCGEWLVQDAALCTELTRYAAGLLTNPPLLNAADPLWRAGVGNALARLGDPRPGVGVKPHPNPPLDKGGSLLPDLTWSEVIPPGPFVMGSDKTQDDLAYDDEQPQFTCTLITDPYRISRYPITVAQYRLFVDAQGYSQQKYWTKAGWEWRKKENVTGPVTYGGVFELDNHPQVGVSWYEAVAFCRWLAEQSGLLVRLPTETEWERAARHTDGRIYPWNSTWDEQRCSNRDLNLGATTPVGIFPNGNAECGAADMSGNVWEWCSTKWLGNYQNYQEQSDDGLEGDAGRVLRGGSIAVNQSNMRCAYRSLNSPGTRYGDFGFRVVLPGSVALISERL